MLHVGLAITNDDLVVVSSLLNRVYTIHTSYIYIWAGMCVCVWVFTTNRSMLIFGQICLCLCVYAIVNISDFNGTFNDGQISNLHIVFFFFVIVVDYIFVFGVSVQLKSNLSVYRVICCDCVNDFDMSIERSCKKKKKIHEKRAITQTKKSRY